MWDDIRQQDKAMILFATETGRARKFATELEKIFSVAFDVETLVMSSYDISKLQHEKLVLIVTSTFGDGDPPDNGMGFFRQLEDISEEMEEDVEKKHSAMPLIQSSLAGTSILKETNETMMEKIFGPYSNVKFSVFGLGSSAYPNFCGFPCTLDNLLGKIHCQRLLQLEKGDELNGQEERFREWSRRIFKISCKEFEVSADCCDIIEGDESRWNPKNFRISYDIVSQKEPDLRRDLSAYHDRDISVCTILERTNLIKGDKQRKTILVKIDTGSSKKINYSPGDHIGIFPCNQPELVKKLISLIDDDIDEKKLIQLQIKQSSTATIDDGEHWIAYSRLPVCSLYEAFERYLDITSCASPGLLKIFSDIATDETEKKRLLQLSQDQHEYEEWKYHYFPTIAEVLMEFPSVRINATLLLSQLPPLQCRYYSISSSPDVHRNQVHITLAVIQYFTQGGNGPVHQGVCSSYLNRLQIGSKVHCYIRPCPSFRLPEDSSVPCLLVAAGTGIAPFRSFWEQRTFDIKQGKKVGKLAILFGCRNPEQDDLFREEINRARKQGAIEVDETAFSRLPGKPKIYVQHVLKKKLAKMTYKWIVKKRGHFYICGDVNMADGVKHAFMEIYAARKKVTMQEAKDKITLLKKNNLFHEDIFGFTLKTTELTEKLKTHKLNQ